MSAIVHKREGIQMWCDPPEGQKCSEYEKFNQMLPVDLQIEVDSFHTTKKGTSSPPSPQLQKRCDELAKLAEYCKNNPEEAKKYGEQLRNDWMQAFASLRNIVPTLKLSRGQK